MTQELQNEIKSILNIDSSSYSTTTLRILIEDNIEQAEQNTYGFLGYNLVTEDVLIPMEEVNRLVKLNKLYNLFMDEMEEELLLIND